MLVETYPLVHPTNDALQNIYTNLCVMRLCGELSRVKSGTRDCNGFDSQHIRRLIKLAQLIIMHS